MSIALQNPPSRPRQQGGIWDYISPSRLNLWLRCPLAFRLKYLDGHRTPTTPSLFLGKRVHHALEVFYWHRQSGIRMGIEDLRRRITESWGEAAAEDNPTFKSLKDERQLREQTVGLVRAYLNQLPSDEPVPLAVETPLESELVDPFTGETLGIPLVGTVDLILDGQPGPRICDFKTAAKSSAPLEVTHEIQLSSYAYLYRRLSGRAEGGLEIRSLIKTKTPKVENHPYAARSDRHFRRLFAVIRAYLDDLDARRFVYRPGLGCSFCDFRDSHCQSWQG
jgi:putative RecB family exonuclease